MVYIVSAVDTESGTQFISAIDELMRQAEVSSTSPPIRVAIDCEGVDLSRIGSVEIVSFCFPTKDVYLVDFGVVPVTESHQMIRSHVKRLLECSSIIKVIHDCRKDSDALYHLHGITMKNVHDTSCFHHVITGQEETGLNDVLQYNVIRTNESRDSHIYRNDPSFWARRPLSRNMIEWASSDVDKLVQLSLTQLDHMKKEQVSQALRKTESYVTVCRDMCLVQNLRVDCPGLFIGKGGSNIRHLRHRTGTQIYQENRTKMWYVYYPNALALSMVQREMNHNGRSDYF